MSGSMVTVQYSLKWGYYLQWGNETFYDDRRCMRTWETPEAAMEWVKKNHPELEVEGES